MTLTLGQMGGPHAASGGGRGSGPAAGIPTFVGDALGELRYRNALVVAWVHIVLRVLVIASFVYAAVAGVGDFYLAGLGINAVFLGAGVVALALLRRRWATPWVIGAIIAIDCLGLAVGGWRVTHTWPAVDVGMGIGWLLGATELVLLFGALVLPEEPLKALGAAATASIGLWCVLARVSLPLVLGSVAITALFAVTALWAGRRMVRLAVQESLEAYSGQVLRAHQDELEAANGRILAARAQTEQLTQLVVHDLKNPLSTVLANVGIVHGRLAAMPGLAAETEDLHIALEEGNRLVRMIGDLLLIARLEAGHPQNRLAPTRVREVFDAVARAMRAPSSLKGVQLEIDATRDLVASMDAALVRRLVENLTSNALRHSRAGDRIQLAAVAEPVSLRIAVRNTGPAVSAEARARLFEKHQTHGHGEWSSFGLGLYLCRLVAEAHGGRIELADREGWNVSFETILPMPPHPPPLPQPQTLPQAGI